MCQSANQPAIGPFCLGNFLSHNTTTVSPSRDEGAGTKVYDIVRMTLRQCWIAIVLCLSCSSCFAVCTFLLIFLFFHPFTSPSCTYSLLCQPRALLVSLLLLLPPQQGSPPLPPLTMLSGDEDHELDQPPQESIGSLSSLLDTESKFRSLDLPCSLSPAQLFIVLMEQSLQP